MKFLIAGLGSIGNRHLQNLLALGERDIVLYRTGHSVINEADKVDFPVETDLQDALAHHPDAVIISNPTALHLETAIPAAQVGCHLLIEKPISHTPERLDEFAEIVQRTGVRVLVGYHFRYNPGLEQVRHILNAGLIGRPLSVHAHWGEYLPAWHPWEDFRRGYSARPDLGGGVVLTLSHPLDYLRWLLGEVEAVWGFTGRLGDLDIPVEDTAEIGMVFTSGVIGSLHLDYNQRPAAHYLEITATQGVMRWDSADSSVRYCRFDTSPAPDAQSEWQVVPVPNGFERNTMFLDEMRHFIQVIKGKETPRCSLKDGSVALQISLAALRSAQDGILVRLEKPAL